MARSLYNPKTGRRLPKTKTTPKTPKKKSSGGFSGPVRPGTDVETFRETGEAYGKSTLEFETPAAAVGMTETTTRYKSRSRYRGSTIKAEGVSAQEVGVSQEISRDITPRDAKKVKPLSVEAYDPEEKSSFSQGYGSAIAGGFGAFGRNIKQFFTGRTHKYEEVGAGLNYVDLKKDRPTIIERHGTISDQDAGPLVTYGEIQEDIEVKRASDIVGARGRAASQISEIQKEYQGQIDTGEITLEDAEKGYTADVKPIQEKFEAETSDIYAKQPDVPGLYTYGGTETKKQLGTVLDIAGYTGAAAIAGPAGVIGYGTARGLSLAAKGDIKDIRTMDMGIAELSPESKQAGMHLGMAVISGVSLTGKIAKQIDVLRLNEGMISESGTIGQLHDVGGEKWLKTYTRQKTPYFETTTAGDIQIVTKKGGEFALASGRGTQTTKFLPFSEQIGSTGWKTSTTEFGMAGRGFSGKAVINDIMLPGKYSASLGEGYIIRPGKDGYTSFKFAGTSRDAGKFYAGRSGKLVKARMYVDDLRMTVLPDMKDTSIILKEVAPSLDDVGLTYMKTGGKSMSVMEQVSPQIQELGGGYSSAVSKTVTEDVVSTLVKQSHKVGFKAPSAYAGTGMYEQTSGGMVMEQMNMPQLGVAVGGLVRPMVDTVGVQNIKQGGMVMEQMNMPQLGVAVGGLVQPMVEAKEDYTPIVGGSIANIYKTSPSTDVIQTPITSPIVKQKPIQDSFSGSKINPFSGFATPLVSPGLGGLGGGLGGGFGLPPIKFPSGSIGKKGPSRKMTGMGDAWVGSSYAAKVFDIRGKEGKGSMGGMFTGLEIKPLTLKGEARVRKKGTKKKKKR